MLVFKHTITDLAYDICDIILNPNPKFKIRNR